MDRLLFMSLNGYLEIGSVDDPADGLVYLPLMPSRFIETEVGLQAAPSCIGKFAEPVAPVTRTHRGEIGHGVVTMERKGIGLAAEKRPIGQDELLHLRIGVIDMVRSADVGADLVKVLGFDGVEGAEP